MSTCWLMSQVFQSTIQATEASNVAEIGDNELTIRALSRGLQILAVLNSYGSASLAQISRETGLPRPTTYRLLRSLLVENYITKNEELSTYHAAARCCSLSSGFIEDAWLSEHAQEPLDKIGRKLVWPLSIATNAGTRMIVRANTDIASPLAVRTFMPGTSLPLLDSASGKVFLANMSEQRRDQIFDVLREANEASSDEFKDPTQMRAYFKKVREGGYAMHSKPGRYSNAQAISVPLMVREKMIAAVTIRYAQKAVSDEDALENFLPRLQRYVKEVGAKIQADNRALSVFGLEE